MNERLCLRCDWTGEEKGAACPRCGALLYRPGDADPTATGSPAEPPREDASGHPWLPATAVDRPRAAAIVLASVVVAGIAFAVIYLNTPDPGEVLVGVEGSRSATPTGRETPTIDDPPSATSPSSPTEPGTCPDEPGAGIVAPTEAESAAAAVTADYRFEDSLLSSVGAAPALVEIGRGSSGFAHEAVLGQTRSVLRFDRGRGLSLTPTSGVIGSEEFTIELLFRFCHVAGYRKIDRSQGRVGRWRAVQPGRRLELLPQTARSTGGDRLGYVRAGRTDAGRFLEGRRVRRRGPAVLLPRCGRPRRYRRERHPPLLQGRLDDRERVLGRSRGTDPLVRPGAHVERGGGARLHPVPGWDVRLTGGVVGTDREQVSDPFHLRHISRSL